MALSLLPDVGSFPFFCNPAASFVHFKISLNYISLNIAHLITAGTKVISFSVRATGRLLVI